MINPDLRSPYIGGQFQKTPEETKSKENHELSDSVLNKLPIETLSHVCSFLPQADLARMSMIDKRRNILLNDLVLKDRQKDLETFSKKLKEYFLERYSIPITCKSEELNDLTIDQYKEKLIEPNARNSFKALTEEMQTDVIQKAYFFKAFIEKFSQIETTPPRSMKEFENRLKSSANLLADFFIAEETSPEIIHSVFGLMTEFCNRNLPMTPRVRNIIIERTWNNYSEGKSFVDKFSSALEGDDDVLFKFYTRSDDDKVKHFNLILIHCLAEMFVEINAETAIAFSEKIEVKEDREVFLKQLANRYHYFMEFENAFQCYEKIGSNHPYNLNDIEALIGTYTDQDKILEIFSIIENHLPDFNFDFLSIYVTPIATALIEGDRYEDLESLINNFHHCIRDEQREVILSNLLDKPQSSYMVDQIEDFFDENPYEPEL